MYYKISDFNNLRKQSIFHNILFFDTETIGLYGEIRLAQFYQTNFKDEVVIIENPNIYELISFLNECVAIVGHNILYDISTIQKNAGNMYWLPRYFNDTLYASRLLYYDLESFKLDSCIQKALSSELFIEYLQIFQNKDKQAFQTFDWSVELLPEDQLLYAASDVYYLSYLYKELELKNAFLHENYKLDIKIARICATMQLNGLPVLSSKVKEAIEKNTQIKNELNVPINCNSYKQVREYLQTEQSNDLGLVLLCFSKDKEKAEKAKNVRTTRKVLKENSFLKKFIPYNSYTLETDDKIFGKFAPNARSGRCICSNQNLHQIPRNTKKCFGVYKDSEKILIYSDFSQLELRCAAILAQDITMIKLFQDKKDLHLYTAQILFDTENPTKEHRQIAKTCNFGLLYGMGVQAFQIMLLTKANINIPLSTLQSIVYKWKSLYKGIHKWQKDGSLAFENNTIWQTPLKRKYKANLYTDQLNIQVQGMGAEVAKLALINIYKDFSKNEFSNYNRWLINFVHDSYLFEIPKELETSKICEIIAFAMQESWQTICNSLTEENENYSLKVPMPVEVKVGYNWGELENNENLVYSHKKE